MPPIFSLAVNVLRKGVMLTYPESWKNAQVIGSFLVALVLLVEAAGFPLPFADDWITQAAAIIAALVNAWATVATTEKIGI